MYKNWLIVTVTLYFGVLFPQNAPQWTAPIPIPGTAALNSIFFPVYQEGIQRIVTTWADDPTTFGFSSTFNGSNWESAIQISNIGANPPIVISSFVPPVNRLISVWSDGVEGQSSLFDGTSWSATQTITGSTPVIPFPAFDQAINRLVATWSHSGTLNGFSSTFDGANWESPLSISSAANAFVVFPAYFPMAGQLVAVWVDIATNNGFSSTFDGATWSPSVPIASNIFAPNVIPLMNSVANREGSQMMVVWADNTTRQGFSAVFNGTSWSSPTPIPGSSVANAIFPVYDPSLNRTIATWADQATNQGYYALWDGTSWSEGEIIPGAITTEIVGAFDPALGKVIVTWRDFATGQGFSALLFSPSITFTGGGNLGRLASYINFVGQSGAMQPILASLNRLNPDQLTAALSSISPTRNSFMPYMAGRTSISINQAMEMHSADLRQAIQNNRSEASEMVGLLASNTMPECCYDPCQNESFAVWVAGLGSFSHQDSRDGNPAFDANTGGGMVGFDYYVDRLRLMSAFTYAHTDIDDDHDAGGGDINSYMGSVFGTYNFDPFFVELGASGGYNTYKSDRHIVFPGFDAHARAKYHGWQGVPHIAAGYNIEYCDFVFEPFASADLAIVVQDSFSETGAAPLNVSQPSNTAELLQARAGFRTYYTQCEDWGLWFIQVTTAYQYTKGWGVGDIRNAFFVGQPTGFTVTSLNGGQNAFVPRVEFFIRGNRGIFFSANYLGEFSSPYMSNAVFAKIGVFF